jgi:predicted RecA/RadA family phage recombinase
MAMEKTFQAKFEEGKVVAWQSGRLAAIAAGSSHGVTVALPFFAQGEIASLASV